MPDEEIVKIAMNIISYAGAAKGLAYDALDACEMSNFDKAKKCINEATNALCKARIAQSQLLAREADGENIQLCVLFIHAQDILMTAITERDLVRRLIDILQKRD